MEHEGLARELILDGKRSLVCVTLPFSDNIFDLDVLVPLLEAYLADPAALEKPFEADMVPRLSKVEEHAKRQALKLAVMEEEAKVLPAFAGMSSVIVSSAKPKNGIVSAQVVSSETLLREALPNYVDTTGPVIKVCPPQQICEEGCEYPVQCVKFIFARYVIFQVGQVRLCALTRHSSRYPIRLHLNSLRTWKSPWRFQARCSWKRSCRYQERVPSSSLGRLHVHTRRFSSMDHPYH